jgi:hypothetical protein
VKFEATIIEAEFRMLTHVLDQDSGMVLILQIIQLHDIWVEAFIFAG